MLCIQQLLEFNINERLEETGLLLKLSRRVKHYTLMLLRFYSNVLPLLKEYIILFQSHTPLGFSP